MALSRSALTSKGGTTKWRRIRQQVINRDRCCQACGTEEMLTVDHIVPRRLGGDAYAPKLYWSLSCVRLPLRSIRLET